MNTHLDLDKNNTAMLLKFLIEGYQAIEQKILDAPGTNNDNKEKLKEFEPYMQAFNNISNIILEEPKDMLLSCVAWDKETFIKRLEIRARKQAQRKDMGYIG